MAINIFSGGSNQSKNKSSVNSSSASTRAKASTAAVGTPAVASDSGSTAVGTSGGTLAKVGNVVGNIAGIASKFLPGVGGVIAKGVSNILNDPEWWQSVVGEGISLNESLRLTGIGSFSKAPSETNYPVLLNRPAILEFVSNDGTSHNVTNPTVGNVHVANFTETEITQYLMPEVRKVVNAVTLQSASDYQSVLETNVTVYAVWRTLKKWKFMMEHGQTYIANMNDPAFPMFQVKNAAYLSSTINRLEEYLRSSVRLPHTMCEYLAWRFGRVYKSNSSHKAALVMYDAIPLCWNQAEIDLYLQGLLSETSATAEIQKANADLYNAYFDHDMMVEVRDDTQFSYDKKEFALRTNLDLSNPATDQYDFDTNQNPIAMDSDLDNVTAFMASSVSTKGRQYGIKSILFPVDDATVYIPVPETRSGDEIPAYIYLLGLGGSAVSLYATATRPQQDESKWLFKTIRPTICDGTLQVAELEILSNVMAAKAVDLYNAQQYIRIQEYFNVSPDVVYKYVDATSIAIDTGCVSDEVIGNEHIFAFANLVYIGRKTSMTYKQAEKVVAKDTANLIEKLDVAAIANK